MKTAAFPPAGWLARSAPQTGFSKPGWSRPGAKPAILTTAKNLAARWLATCLLILAAPCAAIGRETPIEPGAVAPAFSLLDVNGKELSLEELRGKPVLLNFWAFWCDTWKAEMPHLRRLASKQDELGFRLIAVSVDGTRLPEFVRLTGGDTPFPVLLDVGGRVSAQYGIVHVPTVALLDRNGRLRFVRSGYPGNAVVLNELRKLSAEGVPAERTVARPERRAKDARQKR